MDRAALIRATEAFVKQTLDGKGPGHDWHHIARVRRNALRIAQEEGADPFVVELAALLHDIADHKFHGGDYERGAQVTREFLEAQGVDEKTVAHVCGIVKSVSFSKGDVPATLEGRCVQDADRLDAIGAIGVARCFAYGGHKNRPIHEPGGTEGSLQHFHDKLYRIKDKMNTVTGKRLAQRRHEFVEMFEKEFLEEWDSRI